MHTVNTPDVRDIGLITLCVNMQCIHTPLHSTAQLCSSHLIHDKTSPVINLQSYMYAPPGSGIGQPTYQKSQRIF